MKILFVHQSFPGQYRHIVRILASQGIHQIFGMGIEPLSEPIPDNVTYIRYSLMRGNLLTIDPFLLDFDSKLIRARACASVAYELFKKGFVPDIICAHPGWGEALFLKDIWPKCPILSYQEFFYNSVDSDFDFDPELQGIRTWHDCAKLRFKNGPQLLMLQASDWNITPTHFQFSTFPSNYQSKFSIIHDGIDTQLASPTVFTSTIRLFDGTVLCCDDDIITFVNRRIEPYRGCHTFIRSIPLILQTNPNAHIVIVGESNGVSYGEPGPNDCWRDLFLDEISGSYDSTRVHFIGSLPYYEYLSLLKLSKVHIYLTYPFVLSWSLLEAMSIGLPIVASSTLPVTEVIIHNENGLLIDFFDYNDLAYQVNTLLDSPQLCKMLGEKARSTVIDRYSIDRCLPLQLDLIRSVAES